MRQDILVDSMNPAIVDCSETSKCRYSGPKSEPGINCSQNPEIKVHPENTKFHLARKSGRSEIPKMRLSEILQTGSAGCRWVWTWRATLRRGRGLVVADNADLTARVPPPPPARASLSFTDNRTPKFVIPDGLSGEAEKRRRRRRQRGLDCARPSTASGSRRWSEDKHVPDPIRGNPSTKIFSEKTKHRHSGERRNPAFPEISQNSGSVLIYIIVVMMVFGLLGAAMIAMFSSATMMSTGTPNSARQARYLAESGMRYAVSDLRNKKNNWEVIDYLNDTEFKLSNPNKFDLNVLGKWFRATTDYDQTSGGTIEVILPEGKLTSAITKQYEIPAGSYLINFNDYLFLISAEQQPDKLWAEIQTPPWNKTIHPDLTGGPIEIILNDDFEANSSTDPTKKGDELLLAVTPDSSSVGVIKDEDELKVHKSALSFFPERNGAIRLVDVVSEEGYHDVFYEKIVEEDDYAKLSGLKGVPTNFKLNSDDFIILSPYNYIVESNGSVSGTGTSGNQNLTMNYTDPEPPSPRPLSSQPDIEDFASPDLAMPQSAPGTVSVVTIEQNGETKKGVQLGGDVGAASSAAWYGGSVDIGGFDVCTDGKCVFNNGVRVFFIFDYDGDGDGFTFTLASGSNELNSYGFRGEYMGYAGVSKDNTQISHPKMAIEFDTYTNSARNDPGGSNKDYLQYVYWGGLPGDVWDDNTHDTGGFGQKWPPYLPPSYADGEIRTKPVLNSTENRLYFTSNNGYLHELNPETGTPNGGTNFPRWLEDSAEASPALDSRGYIYNPGDNNYLNVFTPTGSWAWWDYVYADARSSPVIDSNDVVYFGDNEGDFYAYEVTCGGSCSWSRKWRHNIGDKDIKCTPDLSPDEKTVYFVSTQANYLYAVNTADGALKWQFDLYGISNSSPTVADDGTIYIGGDGGSGVGYLFAVYPDGSQKWRYDFSPTNPHSRPALGPDGTIYIGNDDDYLYAIKDDETQGNLTWRFLTDDRVRGGPTVHDDGTIWFGSDDNYLYVVDSNGLLIDRFQTGADVQSSPTQGADGTIYVGSKDYRLYAFKGACNPQNIKSRHYTSDNLPADASVSSSNDWLNSGPWAARMEITRSTTLNARNKYEYTLKMWLRQCKDQACTEDTADRTVVGSYFEDTRIAYEAKDPYLEQTVELCEAEHLDFESFIFGYTQGTGGAVQRVTITDTQLAFIRPGDFVVTDDPNWQ